MTSEKNKYISIFYFKKINSNLDFTSQKEFAKLSVDAAEYFYRMLKKRANGPDRNINVEMITQSCLEIATAIPVLSYEYGMLCLDFAETTIAFEILSKVPASHPQYEDAKYQMANISFCVVIITIQLVHRQMI